MLAGVAVVLALVVGAAWYEGRSSELGPAHRSREAPDRQPTRRSRKSQAREADVSGALRDTEAKLALLEARIAESQSQQASLEALYRELAPSRDELALNEVEQVLLLAGQQLAIAGNVQAALAALQLADAKLVRVDRAQLVPLRRALARDIDRLKAVPYVDVAGMSLKLDQVLAAIDSLPLARDERLPPTAPVAPAEDEAPWRKVLREFLRRRSRCDIPVRRSGGPGAGSSGGAPGPPRSVPPGGRILYLGDCCQQATWTCSMMVLRALDGGSTLMASASPA